MFCRNYVRLVVKLDLRSNRLNPDSPKLTAEKSIIRLLSTEKRQVIPAILARDIWLAYRTLRAFHPCKLFRMIWLDRRALVESSDSLAGGNNESFRQYQVSMSLSGAAKINNVSDYVLIEYVQPIKVQILTHYCTFY